MDLTLADQGQGFLYALAVGFGLGAFYDVFRILRVFVRCEKRHVIMQDVFFCFTAGVASFLLALGVNWGEIRFYLLAGEAIGLCAYFLTLGEVTLRLSKLILRIVGVVWRFFLRWLFRPLKRLCLAIWKGIRVACLKVANFLKKFLKKRSKNKKQLESTPADGV